MTGFLTEGGTPVEPPKAPIWRPMVTAAGFYALWLGRQSPEQLAARWWVVYPILAAILAACALAVWTVQQSRGQRWPWLMEGIVLALVVLAVGVGLSAVVSLIRG